MFQNAALAGTLAINGPLPSDTENGFDLARSRVLNGSSLTTLEGPIANLPAGEVLATFDFGLDWQRIESADTRSATDATLTRRQLSTGANVVVPLTSSREEFLDALGTFTLNLQAGVEDLSDFGVLGDWNAGITWQPFDGLDLSATYIWREVAPGLATLGNPQIVNFNVPVFDFVRGETVLADVRTGGNPDLPAETQRDWKFSANWELPFWDGSRLAVDYIRNRSDNVVSGFPQITPEIEAAFPGRVTRDADGRLIAVDRRSSALPRRALTASSSLSRPMAASALRQRARVAPAGLVGAVADGLAAPARRLRPRQQLRRLNLRRRPPARPRLRKRAPADGLRAAWALAAALRPRQSNGNSSWLSVRACAPMTVSPSLKSWSPRLTAARISLPNSPESTQLGSRRCWRGCAGPMARSIRRGWRSSARGFAASTRR